MLVVTVRPPVVGGIGVQVTENAVELGWPATMVTPCEVPPLTVQLDATPESATEWLPAGRLGNVTPVASLLPIDWFVDPSSVTV